jgi:KaiC/GvpD/RAD55 family RecA-like ATPase
VTSERVSSGVERLDTMLGGGYYRGANVLVTGLPSTAMTALGRCVNRSGLPARRAHHVR